MKSDNRFDLQQELGDELKQDCDLCGKPNVTHINRMNAEPSIMGLLIALGLGLVLSSLFFIIGFIALFAFTVPIWYYFSTQKKATDFNKIKIARK